MTSESEIQGQILDFLRIQYPRALVRKQALGPMKVGNGANARNPMDGFPDIFVLMPPDGRYIGFEVKKPGGKPSLAQEMTHAAIRATGAKVFIVTSNEDVKEALAALGRAEG